MKIDFPDTDFAEIQSNVRFLDSSFGAGTVLILGGSGFLGNIYKNFLLYLNKHVFPEAPCLIISVDNYLGRNKPVEIEDPNLIHLEHDLTTPLHEKLHKYRIDYIINAAGCASPFYYERYPLETMDISTTGVRHALRLAREHRCPIINFSSSEVLGTPADKDIPSDEKVIPSIHSLNGRAPYDVTKLYIETISWVYRQKYDVNCYVIRPFNVIGYFRPDDYRVIPNFINKAMKGEKLNVYLPGTQTRTFCWYGDFIAGSLKVLIQGDDLLYHIGNSDNEISMKDLAYLVEKVSGKTDLVNLVPTPEVYKHEPQRRVPSIEKARKELGYNPKVNLEEALRRIYNWTVQNYG
jgi:UDP-glucuronate decarboxylase